MSESTNENDLVRNYIIRAYARLPDLANTEKRLRRFERGEKRDFVEDKVDAAECSKKPCN